MIQWGLISRLDSKNIMRTLDLICQSDHGAINITEVGVYGGNTGKGVVEYLNEKQRECFLTGVDSGKDNEPLVYPYDNLLIGQSNEVYGRIKDKSQDLIFIDACHCFAHVVSDFFCYAPKVKIGGYLLFHDTGEHINPFKDFQHGDPDNSDAYISVRKALGAIGLFGTWITPWALVFDEADAKNDAGGIVAFKRML